MILNYSSVTFGQLADIQCEGLILRSQPAYPTFVVILDRTSFKGQTIDADRKSRRSQQDGVCCQDVCVRGDTGRFRWSKPVNGLRLYEQGENPGAEANMAKMLAADASFEAANVCVQTHGGFGFAEEYDVERKFRETRLYQVAPISTNLVLSYLAEHVLGLPRSY